MIGLQDPPRDGLTTGNGAVGHGGSREPLHRAAGRSCSAEWQEPLRRAAEAGALGGTAVCSGPGSGASRCALRLEPLDRTIGHSDKSPCCGRQEPTLSGRRRWSKRQEPPRHMEGAGLQELLWAPGSRSSKVTGRCGGLEEPLLLAGHCCGWAGAAARGGRSHHLQQEPFPGRQLVGAAAELLWRVSGDASRVDVQQETRLWVRCCIRGGLVPLACRGAPGCGLFLVQVGRCWPRHTHSEGVGARESHQVGLSMAVAVDKEELRTGERGVEPCPIRCRER